MARKKEPERRLAARNRKARHTYFIEETFEAGMMLTGTEVKSLREGRANINEAYASVKDNDIFLLNAHIAEYAGGNRENHPPRRPRKLLLHKREIQKLTMALQRDGMTLVPLSIYFNDHGLAKTNLGLAKGKRQYDKRATVKDREWKRDKARLMKSRGQE
ncbi:MAG: SsrA-binding protein SmpB [Pseudomonadota bacterium]|nr:SsrA-binding protein SmpB [Pseudomonadota bacterium]